MGDIRRDCHSDREAVSLAFVAEPKTLASRETEGTDFPFPYFPPANSSGPNETSSGYTKTREGDGSRNKQRSRSHSRSASSMSTLLLVTTERLGQETNRANALDVRCTEVLTHLRTIVGERDQLRRSLTKVQEELSLYKLQLDVAQNEIFRAQKIVDGVDKARVEAEEQAAKDRTLARELVSERAVWQAREEGRNAGFKEGLRQGRRWAYEAVRKRTRSEEYIEDGYDPVYEDPEPYEPSAQHSSSSGHSRGHWSSPSRSVHSTPPDAASYASTVPRTPSDRSNAPSLQNARSAQQPPRPPSAQPPARTPSARSSRPLPRAPEHLPEPIDIRRDTRPVRPTSPTRTHFRAPSPSMSHRSVAPPPDGFIPTVGADSVIALPPPHELSRPVSMVAETPTPVNEPRRPETPHRNARARTMSAVSAVSTSLSQFDILSPPRPEPRATHSDQVAREWRVANADPPEERPRTAADSNSENFSTHSSIPRARSQASRRSGPPPAPRRPREIIMPMPLSTTMHGDGMSHTRPSTSAGLRREPAQTYGYVPSAGPSSSAPVAGPSAPPMPAPPPQLQEYSENTSPARPRSAISWIKSRFNRSLSSSSVPNIQIEPPSNPASNPSTDCTVNTVLLVPEDAGEATLPQHFLPEFASAVEGVQLQPAPPHAGAATGNVIVLPDNELPRGFVPLSPISPIMPNLHTVPPADLAPRPSPQPPAYSPRDIYAPGPPRLATATGTRSRTPFRESEAGSSAGARRGASIGSAMAMSPPLNRPISIFSEA
ncbi:hypothetical protein C8R47DRAFT_604081 [Mycena vitilis]|nr:hypothetical protein C8R47DRAFT_604081 [Mycena vitilis]